MGGGWRAHAISAARVNGITDAGSIAMINSDTLGSISLGRLRLREPSGC